MSVNPDEAHCGECRIRRPSYNELPVCRTCVEWRAAVRERAYIRPLTAEDVRAGATPLPSTIPGVVDWQADGLGHQNPVTIKVQYVTTGSGCTFTVAPPRADAYTEVMGRAARDALGIADAVRGSPPPINSDDGTWAPCKCDWKAHVSLRESVACAKDKQERRRKDVDAFDRRTRVPVYHAQDMRTPLLRAACGDANATHISSDNDAHPSDCRACEDAIRALSPMPVTRNRMHRVTNEQTWEIP